MGPDRQPGQVSGPGDILSSSSGTGPSPTSFGCLVSCPSGPRLSFACSTPCTGISCFFGFLARQPMAHPHIPSALAVMAPRLLLFAPRGGAGSIPFSPVAARDACCIDSRDHLLELPQRGLGVGARGHIVLDPVDERCIGYASGVGGGVLAPAGKKLYSSAACKTSGVVW